MSKNPWLDANSRHKLAFARELRSNMTDAEILLWQRLRNRNFHHIKFRRQVPIGPFVADFLCRTQKVIVEVDGAFHDSRKEYDTSRSEYLRERGYRVFRCTNNQVIYTINSVLQELHQFMTHPEK